MCNMCLLQNDVDFPLLIAHCSLLIGGVRFRGSMREMLRGILSPRCWNRSAAVSSSTSRSTRQAPDPFETSHALRLVFDTAALRSNSPKVFLLSADRAGSAT